MKKFEVGKYYKHSTGELLHILGEVTSTMYGHCLVGESTWSDDFLPIGMDESNTVNYEEIDKSEWDENWEEKE